MAHQSYIEREKYRQWVKAGLGLGYLKEGLAPFCDYVAKQQHKDILDNVIRIKNIPTIKCGTCILNKLKPDHVKLDNRLCPLHHVNCNCCYTSGKTTCPNNVCGAIYDSIIRYHASAPPAPNWKNTQTQQWIADPWSIAKCFINAPGYEKKTSAADTDCSGLLHVIINNKYFHNHVNMTGPNIFSKVRQFRNEIYHSSTMELDSHRANSYIDDMIAVLQDSKELIHLQYAQEAVKKLQDLKNKDFVISTKDVEKVLGDIREKIGLHQKSMDTTKGDCEEIELKVDTPETFISELKEVMKNLKEDSSKTKPDFDTLKSDLREKLIEEYKHSLLQVSAMPFQQEHLCDFRDVYVKPRITLKSKDKHDQAIEIEVQTMSDIFIKDEKPLKSIYIIGEAGSGKSSFCKTLVQSWCMAHSNTQNLDGQKVEENTENYDDSLQVMEKFNFVFFISLRHCSEKLSITDMLQEEYEHPVLKDLIERESETCLIMLDGLDEWTSRTTFPPKRPKCSNYTVLTTSRPWKIASFGLCDNEIRKIIYINSFDIKSRMNMISKTVEILNKAFPKNKRGKDKDSPAECETALAKKPFISFTKTAIMLQQLVCLWFDDRLHGTSICNLYTCMLDLFFVWYKHKHQNAPLFSDELDKSHDLELSELFNKTEECKSHCYIIQGVSRLAYKTLIQSEEETSLTFDSFMFQQLDISDGLKTSCLKLGILSEEKGPSLSASRSRKSHFSFYHKSVQEYLAAVYIVLIIKTEHEPSLHMDNADLSDNLSKMLNIKTLDKLLEQENVVIMLCGLEPRLYKSISRIVNEIVKRDMRVIQYRTTFNIKDLSLIEHIQTLILNCIEETKASKKINQFCFDLDDLVIEPFVDISHFSAGEQHITLDNAISFCVNYSTRQEKYDGRIAECLTKCKRLEAINIKYCFNEELHGRICETIEANASALKCWSLTYGLRLKTCVSRSPFRHIGNMTHLVALQVEGFTATHEDFTSLCIFLSGTGNLQQISIRIKCECKQQHEIDLSQHKQLQLLEYRRPVVVTNADFLNLEVVECFLFNTINCIDVLDLLCTSMKLNTIVLSNGFGWSNSDTSNCHAIVTSKLINLLSKLHELRILTLYRFTLIDNIVKCPSEMKCIESIDLRRVTMSLATWRIFVDSVAALPNHVMVRAWVMCITRDGEECNPDIQRWRGGGEEAAAFKYVSEHAALQDVSFGLEGSIQFSTKNNDLVKNKSFMSL